MKTNCKGNRHAQNTRRAKRLKNRPERLEQEVQLIDGNWSHYAEAWCQIHGGYLTAGLMATHRCKARDCRGLKDGDN